MESSLESDEPFSSEEEIYGRLFAAPLPPVVKRMSTNKLLLKLIKRMLRRRVGNRERVNSRDEW